MTVKILVCDDDPTFVNQMIELINQQPRYGALDVSITGCSDPSQLSDKLLAEFNIMFLDIDMGAHPDSRHRFGSRIYEQFFECYVRLVPAQDFGHACSGYGAS